jgi:hypothetical protein
MRTGQFNKFYTLVNYLNLITDISAVFGSALWLQISREMVAVRPFLPTSVIPYLSSKRLLEESHSCKMRNEAATHWKQVSVHEPHRKGFMFSSLNLKTEVVSFIHRYSDLPAIVETPNGKIFC